MKGSYFILLLLFIVISLIVYSKGATNSNTTILSVLQIIVAIMIFMGFELIISFNSTVNEWKEIKKSQDEFIASFKNLQSKINKIPVEDLDAWATYLNTVNNPIVEFKLGMESLQRSLRAVSLSILNLAQTREHQNSDDLSGPEISISEVFDKLYFFLQKAIWLFEYPRDNNMNYILDSIEMLHSENTRAALRILKLRLEISESFIRYLWEKKLRLSNSMKETPILRRQKVKRELSLVENLIKNENQIKEKIICIIKNENLE